MFAGEAGARIAALVVLTAGALFLTGCANATNEETSREAGNATSAPAVPLPAAPITPDAATPSDDPTGAVEDADERFVSAMRSAMRGLDGTTDEQWIAAGHEACAQMDDGATIDTVDVIDGDSPEESRPGQNDAGLANIASELYCQEHVGNFAE